MILHDVRCDDDDDDDDDVMCTVLMCEMCAAFFED